MSYKVKIVSYPPYINIDFIKSHYKKDFNIGTLHTINEDDVLKNENGLITFKYFYFNNQNDDIIEVRSLTGRIIDRVKQMKDAHGEILDVFYKIKDVYVSMNEKYGIVENLKNFQIELHQHMVIENNSVDLKDIIIIKTILINLNIFSAIMLISDKDDPPSLYSDPSKLVKKFKEIHSKGLNLFEKKNTDYGDSFATFGIVGIIIRLEDKINRCISITENNKTMVDDESIKDTIFDMVNYATMGVMLINDH
jgi:hypothetical protein